MLPHAGHAHQPLFHRFFAQGLHPLAAFPPPSCCCFLRQFPKEGPSPRMASTFPGAPGKCCDCRAGRQVLGVQAQPHSIEGHTGSCGAWILFLCLIFFLYHIQSCIYSTTAVTRVDMSCHAMLNSPLLPQSLILLLFPEVGQQRLLSGFALSSWASEM